MDRANYVDRRTVLGSIAGVGATSLAGCAYFRTDGPDTDAGTSDSPTETASPYALRDAMELPPTFDCDVWVGTTDVEPIGTRFYRPESGGVDEPADMIEEMDRVGIDRALVYHVTARTEDAKAGNERLMDVVADYPRFEPSWVATPDAVEEYGSPPDFVDAMESAGVGAARMYPGEHDYRLVDDEADAILEALADADALLVLEALSGTLRDGFDYFELGNVCAAHAAPGPDEPGLSVLLTQLLPSMGTAPDSDIMEAVSYAGNLHVDTARLQSHEGARKFAGRTDLDKLLFGTHLPHASAGAGLANVMLTSLSDEEKRQVAGGNLARLLGESSVVPDDVDGATEDHFKTVPYGIVDLHGHVHSYDERFGPEDYPDADGIVRQMDRTGIDLSCVSNIYDGKAGNDSAVDAADRYPDRLVPIAYADPSWDGLRAEVERCFDDLGMRMIKIHPSSDGAMPDDSGYDPVYEVADEREALVVTHARCTDEETAAFTAVANEYPDMTLMLYHAGRGWYRADNFVSVVEDTENTLLEITYSYNVDGIIEHLIDRVGAETVFFGTDIGARGPESQVGWASYARLDPEVRYKHMRENGLRLLDDLGALPDAYADEV